MVQVIYVPCLIFDSVLLWKIIPESKYKSISRSYILLANLIEFILDFAKNFFGLSNRDSGDVQQKNVSV